MIREPGEAYDGSNGLMNHRLHLIFKSGGAYDGSNGCIISIRISCIKIT